jgi:nitroreductase
MDIDRAISIRRTVREYKDKKISKRLLRDIIKAGCKAPSLHNLQPWRFIVLSQIYKKGIADIMRQRAGKELVFLNRVLQDNASIIETAPAVMAVYNTRPLSVRFRRFGRFYESRCTIWEIQSIACSIENMLLKAASLKLGSAIIGCALLCEKEIEKLFNTKDELGAILTFGYPKRLPKPGKGRKFTEIVKFL